MQTNDVYVYFACTGVFALLYAYAILKYVQSFLTKAEFKVFFVLSAVAAAGVIFLSVVGLTWAGKYTSFCPYDFQFLPLTSC